ncbi:MAG: A/G-specific adenine glycosylase [Thiobacillus sp.]
MSGLPENAPHHPGTRAGVMSFAARIIEWQHGHGRHALPWQASRDPYRIWLSEIMLQQTQVATVIPYFERFVVRFPDVADLAAADEDAVLALWSGLGYYSRARNLHAAARVILDKHAGRFPDTAQSLEALPGVGQSTAAAIAALAFGQRGAILDGNVRRVLARHGGIAGWPGDKKVEARLWDKAESLLPDSAIESYTQGMMDLGALVCTRSQPVCSACPVRSDCAARIQNRTAELPTPRPRKALPEKRVQMLILLDRGELLLEKRPGRGIWGGLWSLPELPHEADPVQYCVDQLGLTATSRHLLPHLSHSFTHFKLHIEPVQLHLAPRQATAPGQIWLAPADALEAPLPAPIRKLVERLQDA